MDATISQNKTKSRIPYEGFWTPSSWFLLNELEVRNATLLYENWSTIAKYECNDEVHTMKITRKENNNPSK